ncbi:MAG: DNA primase [Firmicutes bacterium]|nr:DNA primase [Bacillota bacterium]MDH7496109.1 DNA primase [Bacillota bacterium]
MRGFSDDVLDELRAKSDIVEVISGYVALKQAGRTYKGLCPFHAEKTPSFVVSPEKQLFHCFGCGAGGDVFSFVMKIENLSFAEAVRLLADRAGIVVDERAQGAAEAREEQRALYEANEAACEYFESVLARSPEARNARDYLKRRGLADETVAKFRLGFASQSWDALLRALSRRKIAKETLLAAGLVVPGKEPGSCYDRFRARLMFPICDPSGRVIGFGGRVLDDSVPKYLNSPETVLFKKGRTLYGLHLAKDFIRKDSTAVVVEGYMDAITAHQHGFRNVVASLGTALTEEQARTLRRYAPAVVIAYDADAAGAAATVRGMEILADAGLTVKVASLPEGEDPDATLRRGGTEALSRVLLDARPLVDYRLHLAVSSSDLATVEGRVQGAREAAKVIATVRSAVERSEYTRRAALLLKIDPEALGRDVEALVNERTVRGDRRRLGWRRAADRGTERQGAPVAAQAGDRIAGNRHTKSEDDIARSGETMKVLEAEKILLKLMAENSSVRATVLSEIGVDGFHDARHREIARALVDEAARAEADGERDLAVDPAKIVGSLDDEETRRYASGILLGQAGEEQGDPAKIAGDCLSVLRERCLRKRIRELERELASLDGSLDGSEAVEKSRYLLAELGSLRARLSREFQPFSGSG